MLLIAMPYLLFPQIVAFLPLQFSVLTTLLYPVYKWQKVSLTLSSNESFYRTQKRHLQ